MVDWSESAHIEPGDKYKTQKGNTVTVERIIEEVDRVAVATESEKPVVDDTEFTQLYIILKDKRRYKPREFFKLVK